MANQRHKDAATTSISMRRDQLERLKTLAAAENRTLSNWLAHHLGEMFP